MEKKMTGIKWARMKSKKKIIEALKDKDKEEEEAFKELANEIIDNVCNIVEAQHPELKLRNKITKEIGIEKGTEAVICGEQYYNLEEEIARKIRNLMNWFRYGE